MKPPQPPLPSNYLVIESTYGDRLHEKTDPQQRLKDIINRTIKRGGTLLIPAFAVGRTQALLYYIHQLKCLNDIPDVPVFVDSPMATNATDVLVRHFGENRLNKLQATDVCDVAQYTRTVEESKALILEKKPMIIISASGMATGGRVIHHIKHLAPDTRNTILFCGFQAGGTRGDRMTRGEKEIKIFGQMIPIHAEVLNITSTSAHADYEEMLAWLSHLNIAPKKVFITHGNKDSSNALKLKIEQKFHWTCNVPEYLDKIDLS